MFGWWLCLHGERIADVNYFWNDISSQFWCHYHVFPFSPKFDAIGYDADAWCRQGLTLESRYAEGHHESGFIMYHLGSNKVSIRGAFVPEAVFWEAINNG